MERVKAYVDGFNLYYGLREKLGHANYWLDLEALAASLLKPWQQYVGTTYFTARVRNQPDSERRQNVYLEALAAHSKQLQIVEGRYQESTRECLKCHARWRAYEEKETDVSIASAIIEEAVTDQFDAALVISADSDLCPAVRSMKRLQPNKRIIAAFPPKRRSEELKKLADVTFTIGVSKIRQAQLPTTVTAADGRRFKRPDYWK